jgi:hypothetical protein
MFLFPIPDQIQLYILLLIKYLQQFDLIPIEA